MGTRTTLAALLASLLTLTACGGSTSVADPPVSPPSSSAAAPPPKPETAEEFVRRFVAVSNAMEMSGGIKEFLALTRHCKACEGLAKQIASARASGGFYHSRGWTIVRLRHHVVSGGGRVVIDVISAPTHFKMSSRAPVQRYTGGPLTFSLTLRRRGSWKVTYVSQVAS